MLIIMIKYIMLSIYASNEMGEKINIFNTLSIFLDDFHTSYFLLCIDFNVTLDAPLDTSFFLLSFFLLIFSTQRLRSLYLYQA